MAQGYDAAEGVRQRLLAYILPRKPETSEQESALAGAVAAQLAYEEESGFGNVPGNVSDITNDGVSVRFRSGMSDPSYTRDTISPVAWSMLRNAGLVAYALPTAKKP